MKLFSSIYIGSFGVTMKLFQISKRKNPKELDCLKVPMPIVQEISRTGRISMDTADKIISVLSDMKSVITGYKVDDYCLFAGVTLTYAQNHLFLLEQIRLRTGLSVQIFSNSEQRFLEYEAVAQMDSFESLLKDDCVMVDFGGSSIQMTLFHEGAIRTTQHLSLGTFTLRETGRRLMNLPDHREQLRDMIDKEIDSFQKMYLMDMKVKNLIFVGDQNIEPFSHLISDKGDLSVDALNFQKEIEKALKRENRRDIALNTYGNDFADPVFLVHKELLRLIPAEHIVVPKGTINDGMALDYCYKKGYMKSSHDFHEDILSASWAIADRYSCYRPHLEALHVLSLSLFDTMKKYHGLGQRERVLMEVCAILHDCGKYISIFESAQCSHRIILSSEILGLTHKEREIIAAVAKYNRLDLPDYEELSNEFSEEQYWTMVKLLAMLKVANALDRSHKQKMKKVSMRIVEKQLILGVESDDSMALEKGMFQNKADFFEQVFAIRPVIREKM